MSLEIDYTKDYYGILGLLRNASAEDIRKAFRINARKYHPDASRDKRTETLFKDVNEAYRILSDDSKRARYDIRRPDVGHEFVSPSEEPVIVPFLPIPEKGYKRPVSMPGLPDYLGIWVGDPVRDISNSPMSDLDMIVASMISNFGNVDAIDFSGLEMNLYKLEDYALRHDQKFEDWLFTMPTFGQKEYKKPFFLYLLGNMTEGILAQIAPGRAYLLRTGDIRPVNRNSAIMYLRGFRQVAGIIGQSIRTKEKKQLFDSWLCNLTDHIRKSAEAAVSWQFRYNIEDARHFKTKEALESIRAGAYFFREMDHQQGRKSTSRYVNRLYSEHYDMIMGAFEYAVGNKKKVEVMRVVQEFASFGTMGLFMNNTEYPDSYMLHRRLFDSIASIVRIGGDYNYEDLGLNPSQIINFYRESFYSHRESDEFRRVSLRSMLMTYSNQGSTWAKNAHDAILERRG